MVTLKLGGPALNLGAFDTIIVYRPGWMQGWSGKPWI